MTMEEEIEGYRAFEYEKGGCLKSVLKEKKIKKRGSKKDRETSVNTT
jgi:hypothetical protein